MSNLKDIAKKGILEGLEELNDVNEDKSNRVIADKSFRVDDYYGYKGISVNYAKNGDKYKVNYSLAEDTIQKAQYMLVTGGHNLRDNSRIPSLAIDLLYETHFYLKKHGVDLYKQKLTASEIIEKINKMG